MITQDSINRVKDESDIQKVVEYFITLKKQGSNLTASCPFHDEKSGSFHVNPSKGIYKCFGCGVGGDAIDFVIRKENMPFIEAIIKVAEICNITIEEVEDSPEERAQKDKRVELLNINKQAAKKFHDYLQEQNIYHDAQQELQRNRQLTLETILQFQIGYAPDEWQFLSRDLIERGLFEPSKELGLVTTSNERNFDTYRRRIIFPIHNEKGQIVGFGGRIIGDNEQKAPKYINSKESPLYKKERVLYGLFHAITGIRKLKFAIVVEGYYDVISMHQAGATNTVGTCGTAFTDQHAMILKKYTNHVVLMGDGDFAGMEANMKAVNILIKHNIKAEICLLPTPEKEGEKVDPDIFARQHPAPIQLLTE